MGCGVPGKDDDQARRDQVVRTGRWRHHVEHPRDQLVVPPTGRRLEREELVERVAPYERGRRGHEGVHGHDGTLDPAVVAIHWSAIAAVTAADRRPRRPRRAALVARDA